MSTCLCKTTYGKFVTTKTYEWRELQQGTAWVPVIDEYEKFISMVDKSLNDPAFNYNRSAFYTVDCNYGVGIGGTYSKKVECKYFDEKRTTVQYSLSPEPYKSKPKNVQTPPDEDGQESGPFSPPDDPPGTKWDQAPNLWQPVQTVDTCNCIDTSGGEVTERDCEDVIWKEPHINFHTEKVQPVFTATFNSVLKLGWDANCCTTDSRFTSNRVKEYNIPIPPIVINWPPGGIDLPFGLFEGEKICLLKYLHRHVCL